MKYLLLLLSTLLLPYSNRVIAQVYNNGAVYIPAGGNAAAFGQVTNADSGTITNAGNLYALSDITNTGTTGYDGGTLLLSGQTAQLLNGTSPFRTTNLEINNTGGDITVNKRYSVSHQVHFTSGIVQAPLSNEPLEFNPGGNSGTAIAVSGASDVSHVNGYTFQHGTGIFVYPVGDGTRYEPVAANLSINSDGMRCRYMPADAGVAPFVTTGLSDTLLWSYNAMEYWDLSPQGTATGAVTVYYDDYNNIGIGSNYAEVLRVAHKVSSGWNNEGGLITGTQASGTVTTNGDVSAWSPFTLGSTSFFSPLPTELLDFTVMQDKCNAVLTWNTGVENDVTAFDIQYSTDGTRFKTVGSVSARGGGSHYTYSYTPMNGRVYFRLAIRQGTGASDYSRILMLNMNCTGNNRSVTVYPNPVTYGNLLHVNLSGFNGAVTGILYDMAGRQLYVEPLANGNNTIEMDKIAVGTYQLCIVGSGSREVYKIVVTN